MKKVFLIPIRLTWLLLVVFMASICLPATIYAREMSRMQADIHIGDKMPDLVIGTFYQGSSGTTKVSDYNGKLLILYFWSTSCAPCMNAFPKMEKLQQLFGDKIQILLINPHESSEEIREKMKSSTYISERIESTNVPILIASDSIIKLFPHRGLPYHVWIDGDGLLRIFGSSMNTHAKKIQQLLDNKPITFIHTSESGIPYDIRNEWYSRKIAEIDAPASLFSSTFSGYNFAFRGSGPVIESLPDPSTNTIRDIYLNVDVLGLYNRAFNLAMQKRGWDKLLIGPHTISAGFGFLNHFVLSVQDTLPFTRGYTHPSEWTDESFSANSFCYELITPRDISLEQRAEFMLADLNRYFKIVYQIEVVVEKKVIRGYQVVSASDTDSGTLSKPAYEADQNAGTVSRVLSESLYELYRVNRADIPYIFDRIGGSALENVELSLSTWLEDNTLEDFSRALQPYGLELQPFAEELYVIHVRDL